MTLGWDSIEYVRDAIVGRRQFKCRCNSRRTKVAIYIPIVFVDKRYILTLIVALYYNI